MFHNDLELVGLLLLVAAIVAIVTRRLRLPAHTDVMLNPQRSRLLCADITD